MTEHARSHSPHDDSSASNTDPAEFWEQRYAGEERVWSGRVNRTLSDIVSGWRPGRALDLGCGEGGDVLWLAENGWRAQGIDLSPTAVARARAEAEARGLGVDRAAFAAHDLAAWAGEDPAPDDRYDLIAASFLQSPVELPRERVLRAAADRVAAGGHLVVVSHAEGPPWAAGLRAQHQHSHADFPSPDSELAALALDPKRWQVEVAEVREREATGPDGTVAMLRDTVVVARRLAE
ncbi:class I SAM-dependent methyltransferase [Leucobacter insecticola]|uniref:Class I SAM-dependent methyltransferase n=1 Tax=Leucobacter insecticola TaxID=2714934 RepID=A0A6G8FG87_9MICO|nr:methyltransferase domain-containing protein [Leucobacter insecticola]QIM15378.1 class I SAM-dependent methyltransferase [Leucobacter insecticola]